MKLSPILLVALVAAAGVGIASGAVLYTLTINASFSVTVPVSITSPTAAIGFGDLAPGKQSRNVTVTITNDGESAVHLHIAASGLPTGVTLAVYRGLGEYVQGSPLASGASVSVKVQLLVASTVSESIPSTQFQIRCTAE
jgi:hypothetical protein